MNSGELFVDDFDIYDVVFLAKDESGKKAAVRMGHKEAMRVAEKLNAILKKQHDDATRYAAGNPDCKCDVCEDVRSERWRWM